MGSATDMFSMNRKTPLLSRGHVKLVSLAASVRGRLARFIASASARRLPSECCVFMHVRELVARPRAPTLIAQFGMMTVAA